ncbi:hypothetical protein BGW38_009182 [Lunasporangiospora selenospora]|uniref:FRG1-like family-domain-containing protein n=1 Tax=Lunasporangiospora selenospora TaxID=979761 RepID=A0A9P6KGA0_9FUNG|nr:hypothetical protein BGW38_009182 [Lunasporangiospora selenospora]
MPNEYVAKSSKLNFKGDSTKSKKKKRKAEDDAKETDNAKADGWVPVNSLNDIGGPIFLTYSSDPPKCLTIDEKTKKVAMGALEPSEDERSSSFEPTKVQQVFVATVIPDSDRLTLKTFDGRYLSSDKFGIVTADSEAIGMQEEWTIIIKSDQDEGAIALQNHYGKFLSVDEVAGGGGSSSTSGFQIRADADTIGFCELFQTKIQAQYRKKVKKTAEVKIATKDYEFDQSRKFQTWNHGRVIVSNEDVGELKRAQKDGRFSEALLDRRSKLKSDRYCK